jgi:AbrB family looped-hinge helix DNA binding protein
MTGKASMLESSYRVRLSPKCQVVIPRELRRRLGIRAGAELHALVYEGRLELIPVRRLRDMRGFLKGIDTRVPREPDRE